MNVSNELMNDAWLDEQLTQQWLMQLSFINDDLYSAICKIISTATTAIIDFIAFNEQ
jgi:hypothetical protein